MCIFLKKWCIQNVNYGELSTTQVVRALFVLHFDLSKETERELKQGLNWKWKKCRVLKISKKTVNLSIYSLLRAIDGVRTRDPDLGKVVLYQLSHYRVCFVFPSEQYILYYRSSYLSTTFLKKINFFEISNCMFKSYCLHQSLPVYYNIQKENYSHRLFCYDVLKSKRIILQSKRGE